ncbi:MAG: hypothetical protein IKT00_06730 [Prevotella sp.]|nr:hypothetical protein [Prevotella sp.]
MARKYTLLFFFSLVLGISVFSVKATNPSVAMAPSDSVVTGENLEDIYLQYLDEDSRKLYDKMQGEIQKIEEQQQQREEYDKRWNILVIVTSVLAIIPMLRLFWAYASDEELRKSGKAMLYGASVTFLGALALIILNIGQLYFFFKLENNQRQLVFSAIILILAIALWIYAKRSKRKK